MLEQRRIAPSKEQLFTERYAQLLAWALRLTNNHRASAEDLVQDAFIQFTLSNTSLDRIANVDGYLRRMLQYMHFSRVSRGLCFSSISDYESLQTALRVPGISDQIQARDELDQICRYACLRKETSRAGSVLILRFFHDYSPREIAQIIGSTRHSVDEWQRVARRELKLFLREPHKLTFTGSVEEPAQIESTNRDGDIAGAMRQVIFQSRRGDCQSLKELEMSYATGKCLGTQQLSHIVSCYQCLDSVNAMFSLGLLKDRHVPPPQSGGGSSSGGDDLDTESSVDLPHEFKRKLEEIVDHRPGQLSVAIDGELVGTLRVTSKQNELELNRLLTDEFDFIEVFGERGTRLLFVAPSDPSQEEEYVELELSDERRLAISIRPDAQNIRVLLEYNDPTYRAPVQTIIDPLRVIGASQSEGQSRFVHRVCVGLTRLRTWGKEFTAALLAGIRGAEASTGQAIQARGTGSRVGATAVSNETSSERCSRLVALRNFHRLFSRPSTITLIVSLVLSIGILYLKTSSPAEPKPEDLIRRAIAAEVIPRNVVAHRILSLEERRSPEGAVIARHRIEVWEDAGEENLSQRLLDENARLKAGRWKTQKGLSTYDEDDGLQPTALESASDQWKPSRVWNHVPSARGFVKLAQEQVVNVSEKPGSFVLSFVNSSDEPNALIHATLTLRSNDLHAIEQTLFVRLPNETREYRFAEISFEETNSTNVDPVIFSPDQELLPPEPGRREFPHHGAVPRNAVNIVAATSALEVEVLYLLNLAGANQGEQVKLERLSDGTLKIQGVVETDERRHQILQVLAPVRANPSLTIDLAAVNSQPLNRRQRTDPSVPVESDSMPDKLLVEDELRRFVSQTVADSLASDEIRRVASRAVNRAYRSLFHTIELNSLINRFTESELATMNVESREKWLDLLREHAEAVEREAKAFHSETGPIFPRVSQPGAAAKPDFIESRRDLVAAVRRLYVLSVAHQESVCSAFTLSTKQRASDIRTRQFWMSLALIEELASKIRQYPKKE